MYALIAHFLLLTSAWLCGACVWWSTVKALYNRFMNSVCIYHTPVNAESFTTDVLCLPMNMIIMSQPPTHPHREPKVGGILLTVSVLCGGLSLSPVRQTDI